MANYRDDKRFPLKNHRSMMDGVSNFVLKQEFITVPNNYPYIVKLDEIPTNSDKDIGYSSPSISGLTLTENYPPSAGTFYVNYYKARIEFNANEAGQTFLVKYHGKGSPVGADEINYLYYNKSDKTHSHNISGGISGVDVSDLQELEILVYKNDNFINYPSYLNFIQCTCNGPNDIFISTNITKIPFFKILQRGDFFTVVNNTDLIIQNDCIINVSYNFNFICSAFRRNIESGILLNDEIIDETISRIGIRNLTNRRDFKYSISLPEFTIQCYENDKINLFGRNLTSYGLVKLDNLSTWIKLTVF